jgi:signal transduction histidine kinase
MQKPEIPANENERLSALRALQILDTFPEKEFDSITALASFICKTPISIISFIDEGRQWFKSIVGLDVSETEREYAFCAHAINNPNEPFIVENALIDPRFTENPLVTGGPQIRFYAGAPLVTSDGMALGTLCVIDSEPREINTEQKNALEALANQIMIQLELRKKIIEHEEMKIELEKSRYEAERFAHLVSHDIKAPLKGISGLADMVSILMQRNEFDLLKQSLTQLKEKADHTVNLVDGILNHSLSLGNTINREWINANILLREVTMLCSAPHVVRFHKKAEVTEIFTDKVLVEQILLNLLTNAIKYNDKEIPEIEILISENEVNYIIEVGDNGCGIPDTFQSRIFELFQTLGHKDRFGNSGTGIGLNTVKKITDKLDGKVELHSIPNIGSRFTITLPKR